MNAPADPPLDDRPTPLPDDPPPAGDERSTLIAFLEFYRAVFVRKAEGLTDEQARRAACPPSNLTIMGLVRHMADVERGWFRRGLGEDLPPIHYSDADPDGDLHVTEAHTLDEAIDTWRREVDAARENLASVSLDEMDRNRNVHDVRWIVVHMIEEYARHCGHLDLLREAVDGVTGD